MTTRSYFEKLEKQYGVLTFGGLLKAWREAEYMTQTAFAKKVGLSVKIWMTLKKDVVFPHQAVRPELQKS